MENGTQFSKKMEKMLRLSKSKWKKYKTQRFCVHITCDLLLIGYDLQKNFLLHLRELLIHLFNFKET